MPKQLFTRGNKIATGRPAGSKNHEDLNSLRRLLEESFSQNRVEIKQMLLTMLADNNTIVKSINLRIREELSGEANPITVSGLCRMRTDILLRACTKPEMDSANPSQL